MTHPEFHRGIGKRSRSRLQGTDPLSMSDSAILQQSRIRSGYIGVYEDLSANLQSVSYPMVVCYL
jgi:hypothetical protein